MRFACCRFNLPDGLRLANLEQSNLKLAVHSEHQEAEGSGIAQVLLIDIAVRHTSLLKRSCTLLCMACWNSAVT